MFISMVDDWMSWFGIFDCIYSLEEVWCTPVCEVGNVPSLLFCVSMSTLNVEVLYKHSDSSIQNAPS